MAEKKASAPQSQLDAVLAQIRKEFGETSIMRLGDASAANNMPVISTGSFSLDLALGVGGLPRGRIIEVYGAESSGKTTLALHVIANAQREGGMAAFVDAEHALDPTYARKIGVKLDDLLVSQPNSGEEALTITEQLVKSGALDVVVVDSVAALTPQAEIDGNMGDSHVGRQARRMSQAMRKLTPAISRSRTCCIFTHQIREKIGVMFGNPETTTGGRALKFYASVRIDVRKKDQIKQGEDIVGNHVKAKIVKNKVAPPFREAEFDIMFGKGISTEGDILDLAVREDIVEKSGAWFAYNGSKIGQGRENAKAYLASNPEVMQEIDHKLRVKLGLLPGDAASGEYGAEDAGNAGLPAPDKPAD